MSGNPGAVMAPDERGDRATQVGHDPGKMSHREKKLSTLS
jgi:hypothetical protein